MDIHVIVKKRDFKFQMLRNKANAKLQKNIKIAKKKKYILIKTQNINPLKKENHYNKRNNHVTELRIVIFYL